LAKKCGKKDLVRDALLALGGSAQKKEIMQEIGRRNPTLSFSSGDSVYKTLE